MRQKNSRTEKGFTLLEIIVVIIITGILASLAMVRLFSMIEYSRSAEALSTLGAIRQALQRCYNMKNGDYENCYNAGNPFGSLMVDIPPADSRHFDYTIRDVTQTTYTIEASRTALHNGHVGDTITFVFDGFALTKSGTGAFKGIN